MCSAINEFTATNPQANAIYFQMETIDVASASGGFYRLFIRSFVRFVWFVSVLPDNQSLVGTHFSHLRNTNDNVVGHWRHPLPALSTSNTNTDIPSILLFSLIVRYANSDKKQTSKRRNISIESIENPNHYPIEQDEPEQIRQIQYPYISDSNRHTENLFTSLSFTLANYTKW